MKLLVSAGKQTIDALKHEAVDGLIIGFSSLSQRTQDPFDLNRDSVETLKTINQDNVKLYVLLNGIFHEPDLPKIETFFKLIKQADLPLEGILFADLAVFESAEMHGFTDKLIYYPETYVTNPQDVSFWHKQNIKSVVLSREMTLDNIKKIAQSSPLPLTLFAHGYLNMFHSKRRLVKTFFDYTKDDDANKYTHQTLHIKEEIRDAFYPMIQDDHGTHIFRDKPLASFEHLKTLKNDVDALLIDGLFYEPDRFLTIVKDYIRALKGETIDASRYDDHDQGFYFKDTIYQKERVKRGG